MGQLTMPKLGDTMEEGTVARWLKKPGDQVQEGEVIAEIETEKSVMEMYAYESGVLTEIYLPEGKTVPVGTPIAYLRTPDEPVQPAQAAVSPQQTQPTAPEAVAETTLELPRREPGERIKASPLARRVAEAENVDLRLLTGTGPGGRIIEADVRDYLAAKTPVPEHRPAQPTPAEIKPLSSLRRTIARRMTQSKQTVPHFYVTVEVDMKEASGLRKELNSLEGDRPKITFTDMMVKAAAVALSRVPQVGQQYTDEGVRTPPGANIGIAVALEDGLIVPVVRNCERKTLLTIARETKELVERARQGKLRPEEYSGGTITISNLGMFDVDSFIAIVNPPEAAILAVGSIADVPAVVDGQITIRPRMKVTISADHRVLDGAIAARYMQEFKRALEQPLCLLE